MTTWCPCGEWKCDDGANLCPCCHDNASAIRRHISEAIDRVQRASATVEARARQTRLGPNLQISPQGET